MLVLLDFYFISNCCLAFFLLICLMFCFALTFIATYEIKRTCFKFDVFSDILILSFEPEKRDLSKLLAVCSY